MTTVKNYFDSLEQYTYSLDRSMPSSESYQALADKYNYMNHVKKSPVILLLFGEITRTVLIKKANKTKFKVFGVRKRYM